MLDALSELRLTDAVDIALVAGLLYAGTSWLRRSQAALALLGIGLFGALYGVARLMELELTTWLFQGFFAAFTLVLVVIFQDELRQAFEELAAWAMGRRNDHRPRLDAPDVLVDALTSLAREKTGALVVLAGIQRLDRHLRGGQLLGGRLSGALLQSIFCRQSAGHDGAAILEDSVVSHFGVQLPLSKNVDRLQGGTRHSAALGLAERTDALCLVVSEERGTISAAANGGLSRVRSRDELADLIHRFYKSRRALAAPRPLWWRALREQRVEKLAALGAACALWLALSFAGRAGEARYSVDVELLGVPPGLGAARVEPSAVGVRLAGPRHRLLLLDRDELGLGVDASAADLGTRELTLSTDDVRVPDGLRVLDLEPPAVRVLLSGDPS